MALRISERATSRVQINTSALAKFVSETGGPVAAETLDLATEVANEVRAAAPRAKKKTHGRNPGYLIARIYLRPGQTVKLGPYIDVVSPAASPQGFRYASYREWKKDYMKEPQRRVFARRGRI